MQDYFLQKTAPSTSCLYYSVRRLPYKQQRRIILIHALYRNLLSVLFDCQEVGVARTKLQWWRDQVLRMSQGKAQHPILIELQDCLDLTTCQDLIFEMINGIDSYLDEPLFMKEADLYHYFAKTAGARELIILKNENDKDQPELANFAYNVGGAIELIHQIRNIYQYIRKGHFLFTQADLDRCHVELKDFHQFNLTPQVRDFLSLQAQKARQYYSQAWQTSVDLTKNLQGYYRRYTDLYLKTLQVIEQQNYAVLDQYIKLNPLNKLFRTIFI